MQDASQTLPVHDKREGDPNDTVRERMSAFVARLSDESTRRVNKRYNIEQRWILDLQQYHGIYDREVLEKIKAAGGSRVFINLTATKTDALEARLWDMLFPTDDRNWSISPTPVPDLTEAAEAALVAVDDATERAGAAQGQAAMLAEAGNDQAAAASQQAGVAAQQEATQAQSAADHLHERLNEAKRRADMMLEEIDDQLVTCGFQAEARDLISDACKLGIGVIKGPVLGDHPKQQWMQQQVGPAGPVSFVLTQVEEQTPSAHRVDPWSYFPDPDVRRVEDGEGDYERHLMNKGQLRKLARRPGMDLEAIRDLLRTGPDASGAPAYMTDLNDLTGQTDGNVRDVYQVWEYTGPINAEDMEVLVSVFQEDEEANADPEEIDPLSEHIVRIWFCQGRTLSFAIHPLDSGEPIYSVFNIRPDENSVFGFGVPWIMRHPQSILNGAFRMMMDNSGLSTGPQIVINKDQVTPEDGNWRIEARKVWLRNSATTQPGVKPFEAFNIPSNQEELANIVTIAREVTDEVTAMPALAQGEQGAGVTKTAQGMALLMNSVNVTFRRLIKCYDDNITVPLIRRFYHWNMQFNPKEEIKGDYEVKARGSGVLLVREMQAQNLLMIAQLFGAHPVYGPMLKHAELLRSIFRAHMISADEITRTDREYKQFLADQQQQADPEAEASAAEAKLKEQELELRRQEMDLKVALSEGEWAARQRIAELNYDAAMEKAAASLNMRRDELDNKLGIAGTDGARKERALAAEIAMKQRTGDSSGGSV